LKKTFAREMELKMQREGTYLITGDLGFSMFEGIKQKFPDRYLNAGISEQNMIGVAAGIALTGMDVFVYSIIPFLLYRPFEQIRNDVCYQNLPVRLVGAGAGFAYSDSGFTHHAVEDYGMLQNLPNITILSPSDPLEVVKMMEQIDRVKGPVYLRLTQNGEPNLHQESLDLSIGKALKISEGDDVLIVSTGSILAVAMEGAKSLEEKGISVSILEYHTVMPFDEEALMREAEGKRVVATVEEHLIDTGLFSMVSRLMSESALGARVLPFGVRKPLSPLSGNRDYMRALYGLTSKRICEGIYSALKGG
jgi:transketolase